MSHYSDLKKRLKEDPKRWLVTGGAGFIGSNLVEELLSLDQHVVVMDNFTTGHRRNLDDVRRRVGPPRGEITEMTADITVLEDCRQACGGVDYVLHQAALASVPRSMEDPVATHASNVTGFVNILRASVEAGVKRIVFASSSAVYGDETSIAKVEDKVGDCLSPYALSKRVDELYAGTFARCYGLEYVALRYFNIFGPRQDPHGAYAAVIPKWAAAMIENKTLHINGDGGTSRDFCYVADVVQANLLAATVRDSAAINQTYNVAVGRGTTLNELFVMLKSRLVEKFTHLRSKEPVYRNFQPGDVRHSLADIGKASRLLGYEPVYSVQQGLDETLRWRLESSD
jgi:UDP-N-acetylglucosamine 4-epimerase